MTVEFQFGKVKSSEDGCLMERVLNYGMTYLEVVKFYGMHSTTAKKKTVTKCKMYQK